MDKWFLNEESIVKPEFFAPDNLRPVKVGVIVFIKRVYECTKSMASNIILEEEESIIGCKRHFATKDGIAVFYSYFGAPAAVALTEALIAAGIKKILVFGEAGSISPNVNVGEIVIPTFAIREEGTSYHYLPPNVKVAPTGDFLKKIAKILEESNIPFKMGGVWSTDAPFRETISKVKSYSNMGVLAVDMECSAVFALSMYRRSDSAALLVITDTSHEGVWRQSFEDSRVINSEKNVSEVLMSCLKTII